jgi:hypothetical protein
MDLKYIIKRVIKEEFYIPISIKRRSQIIDEILKKLIQEKYTPQVICKLYFMDEFIQILSEDVAAILYSDNFSHIINLDDYDWDILLHGIFEYIDQKWGSELEKYYHINCGD